MAQRHRCTPIETYRSQTSKGLSDSELKATPLAFVGVVHAEDLGATRAPCLKSPSGSAGGRPSTSPMSTACPLDKSPSASSHGATPAGQSTQPRPQRPQCDRSMVMAATRTKPVKKPTAKKRAGAKTTKKMERLLSKDFELEQAEATMLRAL